MNSVKTSNKITYLLLFTIVLSSFAFLTVSTPLDVTENSGNLLIVNETTHPTWDDIFEELLEENPVYVEPGIYPANLAEPEEGITIYDLEGFNVSITFHPDAIITLPEMDEEVYRWIYVGHQRRNRGFIEDQYVNVTEDIELGQRDIKVTDTSGFNSGDSVGILDDRGWAGIDDFGSGELAIIDVVIDETTLRLRDGIHIPHPLEGNIRVAPHNRDVTVNWEGGTFDVSGTIFNTMMEFSSVSHSQISDIEFTHDGSGQIHRFIRTREGYDVVYDNLRGPKKPMGGNVRGELLQIGAMTKYVELYNSVAYGRLLGSANLGDGPGIRGRVVNCRVEGSSLTSDGSPTNSLNINNRQLDFELNGVTFTGQRTYPIWDQGNRTRIIDTNILGCRTGPYLGGVGTTLKNLEIRNIDRHGLVMHHNYGSHIDAGKEPYLLKDISIDQIYEGHGILYEDEVGLVRMEGLSIKNVYGSAIRGLGAETRLYDSYIQDGSIVLNSEDGDITIKNVELDNNRYGIRITGGENILIESVEVKNTWGYQRGVFEISNFEELILSEAIYKGDEAYAFLVTEEDEASKIIIDNCDASQTSNGFKIEQGEDLVIARGKSFDEEGRVFKGYPVDLYEVRGAYEGEIRLDDGTNTDSRGTQCVWDAENETWVGSDGSIFPLDIEQGIDYIRIVSEGGSGEGEITDTIVQDRETISGFAAGFNETTGYVRDVQVEWSVINDGSTASTSPRDEFFSNFYSDTSSGIATWLAEYDEDITHSVRITVDNESPELTISRPEEGEILEPGEITIEWDGIDDLSGISIYEIQINGDAWINMQQRTDYTYNFEEEGTYTVRIRAVDEAGNDVIESVEFTIEESDATRGISYYWILIGILAILISSIVYVVWIK